MSQCVPSWDLDDTHHQPTLTLRTHSNSMAPDVPMLDYEVAELTWENGQLAMHGLGPPRVPAKYTWEKPRATGTLESIVNQGTRLPNCKPPLDTAATAGSGGRRGNEVIPWFDPHRAAAASATATMTMDALVPCSRTEDPSTHVMESVSGVGTCVVGCSTRVGSCSGAATTQDGDEAAAVAGKRAKVARVPTTHEWSSRADQSVSTGSATFGRDSRCVTLDTCERDLGLTSTSLGSAENTSSGKPCTKATTADDHDSVCHSRPQRDTGEEEEKKKGNGKSSVSTKRSRAAAIHNQSERKRRDKINQRMKTLQKLVPNSSKTDKASMLDEVIEYLKQLQAQVQMMSRMNMPTMMLPLAMQQQLQMSMMAPMSMGMGIGMGMGVMDMNTMGRPNITGMSPLLHPTAFMPLPSWDASADRVPPSASVLPDPLSSFLACQSQPMTMDAYSRMAALYHHQQMNQPPASSFKS